MKRHLILLVTVVTLSFSACGDKENVAKDSESPTVSFLSPSATAEKLWNNIEISVDAKDDEGVSKVKFYIDGTLLETVDTSPYTMTLNSRTYEDGKYAVKAVAFDNEGNEGEATREIEIFNKLLIVDMPLTLTSASADWWVFLSDNEGNIIVTKELVLGQLTIFERPADFNDETYSLNTFRARTNITQKINYVNTYSNVTPRKWVLKSAPEELELDDITVNITGVTTEKFDYVRVNNYNSIHYSQDPQGLVISPKVSPLSVYYAFENKHDFLKDLAAGESYDFEIADFKTPDKVDISLPENNYSLMRVSGEIENGFLEADDTKKVDGGTETSISLVKSFFTNFKTYLFLINDDVTYINSTIGETIPTSYNLPTYEIDVEDNSMNNYVASFTGDFDIMGGRWVYEKGSLFDGTYESFRWSVFKEAGNKSSVILPELPSEIKSKYGIDISGITYSTTSLAKHFKITSYSQYLDLLYSPDANILFEEYEQVSVIY